MREKQSVPVSIPLNILPKKLVSSIRKKKLDITKDKMAPPESLEQNRMDDAQLLVAFSEEPRAKVPTAPKSTSTKSTKDLRSFRKIAHVPEDLPTAEPDPPIPARILDPSVPAKVFCDKNIQTDKEELENNGIEMTNKNENEKKNEIQNEMLKIIQTNNITRRQLLRLVGTNDVNNNEQAIIEIEENPPNDDIPEDIIAHSDFLKGLIMKNYKGHNMEEIKKKYELITSILTNGNINTNNDSISGQENNIPTTSNENNQEQDVDVSPESPPEIDICAGTSESTSSTVNNKTADPALKKIPAALNLKIPNPQQMTAASHMLCILQLMNPKINEVTADAQREISSEDLQVTSSESDIRQVPLMIYKTLMDAHKIINNWHKSKQSNSEKTSTTEAHKESSPNYSEDASSSLKAQTEKGQQDPVKPQSISLKAQKLLTELQEVLNMVDEQKTSRNLSTLDAQKETLPEENQASQDDQQLPTNLHELISPASQNPLIPDSPRETLSENAQATPAGFRYPPASSDDQQLPKNLHQLDPALRQRSPVRNLSSDTLILSELSQAAPSPAYTQEVPLNQASLDAPTLRKFMDPAFKPSSSASMNFFFPDVQRETLPGNSQVVPSIYQSPPASIQQQVDQAFLSGKHLSTNLQEPDQSSPTRSGRGAQGALQDLDFKCDLCLRRFRTKHGLSIHRTRIHKSPNTARKPGRNPRNSSTHDTQRGTSPDNCQAALLSFRHGLAMNAQQVQQLASKLQQQGITVGNLPPRPTLTYPHPASGCIPNQQQVIPTLASHHDVRMQSPASMHPCPNVSRPISPSHPNNFLPAAPTGMFEVCPNTTVGEGRHAFEHVGAQKKDEVQSKWRRSRGRDATLPMSLPGLPFNYNKYQFLMHQQKLQEVKRQQQVWKTNYPYSAWGRQA